MGVKPTPTNYKTFTFAGENSRDYGVYITGEGVFNAPERNVEMIDIPGRNGAYALDKGNFSNIELTYPAGIVADTEEDFAEAVSELRNLLCSQTGYVRLEDDYNPDEYRMAIYKSGLEVEHDGLLTGEFEITFDCKPQRYLKSGETAVSVTSGDSITNPTRFDARPQLQVWGYGDINLGGEIISVVDNAPIGNIQVYNTKEEAYLYSHTFTFEIDDTFANVGDDITVNNVRYGFLMKCEGGNCNNVTASVTGDLSEVYASVFSTFYAQFSIRFPGKHFAYGTAKTLTGRCNYTITHSQRGDITSYVDASLSYDGTATFTFSATYATEQYISEGFTSQFPKVLVEPVWLGSTMYPLGNPLYIDLDVGEAYEIENDTVISCNNSVSLPPELPSLVPEANTITFDNTFTDIKIVPRWWKV